MAARAFWKGKLKLNSTTIPIALYAAVTDRSVHFHILEKESQVRVKQHMVNPQTNEDVPRDEIQKGYEIEPGAFVVLSAEELEDFKPEPSREIEITRFVSPERISSQWYDRPYYLGPDGNETAYFALVEALAKKEKEGIVRWVMRGNEYVGALRSQDGYLMLVTLRHSEEVVVAENLSAPEGRALQKNELNIAKQLVNLLEGDGQYPSACCAPTDFQSCARSQHCITLNKKEPREQPMERAARGGEGFSHSHRRWGLPLSIESYS